jgi:hypothetical protein
MRANRHHPIFDAFTEYADGNLHVAIKAIDEVKSQHSPSGKISVGKVADTIDTMLHRPPKDRTLLNNLVPPTTG